MNDSPNTSNEGRQSDDLLVQQFPTYDDDDQGGISAFAFLLLILFVTGFGVLQIFVLYPIAAAVVGCV